MTICRRTGKDRQAKLPFSIGPTFQSCVCGSQERRRLDTAKLGVAKLLKDVQARRKVASLPHPDMTSLCFKGGVEI